MKFDSNIKKHMACIVAILAAVLALATYLTIDGPQDTGKAAIVSTCIFVAMLMSIVNITVEIHDKEGGALGIPFLNNSVAGPEHVQRTHRQELELALIGRMAERYGSDVGKRVKNMVDDMLAQDGPPMPSPDEQVAERALRQVLSIVQRYLPPDGISIDDAMSQIIALVDPFPVRSSAGEAAQPVAAVLSDDLLSSAGYGKASCGGCKKVETIELAVVDPGALPESTQAPGTAPRVTKEDLEAEIASEWYINGATGVVPDDFQPPVPAGHPLSMLTICVLILRNGTKVVGFNYGAIDPAQHSVEVGRQEARTQAVDKVWELLGFRLRDKLAAR